jgi:polysaccharide biosynthesis transport protein
MGWCGVECHMKSNTDAPAPGDGALDLRSLGPLLLRRKGWFIWPTLLVALAATVVVNLITPRYKSEARIVYDGRENVFLRPEAEKPISQERSPPDAETLTNQVQIVLSRDLALDVIRQLKLNEMPEFDPLLNGASRLRHVLALAGLARDLLAMSPEERVLESWYDRLSAYPVDKSRVIVIEFQSRDPALAAHATNAIAETYLRLQQGLRQEQTRGASLWLAGEIDTLRGKVADAEAKVEEFRARTNLLVGTNNTTLSSQRLGEFNSQLAVAGGQKADVETRARIIRDMLRRGDPIEASDVGNSELIRRLSEQRVTLRAQLAEQSSTLLDGHPRIKELKAQISDLDRLIRAEAEKIVHMLENEAQIAGARVDALNANLDTLKRQAASTNEQDVQLRALEREAKAQRDLLESYLARYRETIARESIGTAPPDARIISAAIASNTPYFPKKAPIVALATLITLASCIGLVTTRELLSATREMPLPPDAQEALRGRPMSGADSLAARREPRLGASDAVSPLRTARAWADSAALSSPPAAMVRPADRHAANLAPALDEADAAAAAGGGDLAQVGDVALWLRQTTASSRGVAVFSAAADLPTAQSALILARLAAADAKVVVVRLVGQESAAEALLAWPDAPGLTDVISGASSFGRIIGRDRLSRVHLVNRGWSDLPLTAIVTAPRFKVMMEALERAYDHVIIDVGYTGGDFVNLAAVAPRCVLIAREAARLETLKGFQMLTNAGFADIAVMSSAEASATAPSGLEAA